MYEAYYGLTEKPFNLTPDPRFLYLSPKHKEAFAHLMYGIRNRSGFVMVSGEIGTGKTTICRSLLKQLDPNTEVAFIFNPYLSPEELLKKINRDFGIESSADSVRGLIDELNEYLLRESAEGKNCVLIIDEAQNLETEILEQIRLLSNLETETQKLLQIILIGQPELAQKLELHEMRQLNQRITARYHLEALNEEESLHYIAFRLRVAGGGDKIRFDRKAVKLVYKISQGTPRVINALCDRALLIGYTKELTEITANVIHQAAEEIQGDAHIKVTPLNTKRILRAAGALSFAAAGFMAFLVLTSGQGLSWEKLGDRVQERWATLMPTAVSSGQETDGISVDPEEAVSRDASLTSAGSIMAKVTVESDHTDAAPQGGAREASLATLTESVPPSLDLLAAQNGALSSMLRAWNMAELEPLPQRASRSSIESFGKANGLSTTPVRVTVTELGRINYPAIVEMDFGHGSHWGALLGLDMEQATVTGGDGQVVSVTRSDLERAYQGIAILFWLDTDSNAAPLRAYTRNDAVSALQSDLRRLGLTDREPTGQYDGATIETITQIQRATGIAADGICGDQTRMVLSAWLGGDGCPHLTGEAFPADVYRSVAGSAGMVIAQPTATEATSPVEDVTEERDAPVQDIVAETVRESREVSPLEGRDSYLLDSLTQRGRFALPIERDRAEAAAYTPLLPRATEKPLDSVTPSSESAVPLQPSNSTPERGSATP